MSLDKKIHVALFFGGQSSEHDVSMQSARNIFDALDAEKYDVLLIYISKAGRFFICEELGLKSMSVEHEDKKTALQNEDNEIAFIMGGKGRCVYVNNVRRDVHIDIAFPILHGPFGEDGTIQGLFRMAGVSFVGPGVIGSAIGMDKDVAKRLLREGGFLVADFMTVRKTDEKTLNFDDIKNKLGLPLFIKPANAGSSIGVSKVSTQGEFLPAISEAFRNDTKILIEEAIVGREIECAVLGNTSARASVLGEIAPTNGFYSYKAKYTDDKGATLTIPANLPSELTVDIQNIAVAVFACLECTGMTRVDFFVTKNDEIYINEINTIPGFTSISMYPKLWEASDMSYSQLLDTLIVLGLEQS